MKFNVFGRLVEVVRCSGQWHAYYLGVEGKKRSAQDIIIASDIEEQDIAQYLEDLCHEWATEKNNWVRRLT